MEKYLFSAFAGFVRTNLAECKAFVLDIEGKIIAAAITIVRSVFVWPVATDWYGPVAPVI